MAKMSKKRIKQLTRVLEGIMSAESFLKADRTLVCRQSTGHVAYEYEHKNPEAFGATRFITAINKAIGSELNYLYTARKKLQEFLRECNT